jgi:hypothetical protein
MGRITSPRIKTGLFQKNLTIYVRGDFSNVTSIQVQKNGAFFISDNRKVFYDIKGPPRKKSDHLKLTLRRRRRKGVKNPAFGAGPGDPVSGTFTVTLRLDNAYETCLFEAIDYVD